MSEQSTPESQIQIGVTDAVAVVTLDRPRRRNALDSRSISQLAEILDTLDRDSAVNAVILTGISPGFCAGSDLKELSELTDQEAAEHEKLTGNVVRRLAALSKPTIAAVEGFAIGGGYLLATACDIVVSGEDARWDLPEVRLGWVPPWGLHGLASRTTRMVAQRLAWGDRMWSTRDLCSFGVIDEIVSAGDALTHALGLAAGLAALPPAAVVSTKRAFTRFEDLADPQRLDTLTNELFLEDYMSSDAITSVDTNRPRQDA